MSTFRLLLESITTAALLLAWCGLATNQPVEGRVIPVILLTALSGWHLHELLGSATAAANVRLGAGQWWGTDALVRHLATPLAIGAGVTLADWACLRASVGMRLGGYGSLLVLLLLIAVCAKFVAETYLYAQLGAEPSQRQASAELLNTRYSLAAKLRYFFGAMGGIILPLGAQLLAGGAKNIPAVTDAGPPAVLAVAALVCLLPAELLERWLFWRTGSAEKT